MKRSPIPAAVPVVTASLLTLAPAAQVAAPQAPSPSTTSRGRPRQHNEAMLMPVRTGTSLPDLDTYFAAVDAGRYPADSPFSGGPTGVVPLSPGRSVVLTTELPAGKYALVTWVRHLGSGKMYAARGMRALTTVGG
ncbi:hypothetical protein [Streptomyces cavernae]|uniref:hypothetical protein n=1 Tax=Streptomyces cavernae TaxID=2259034 RepID=UPI000FEBC6F4|nr:hypothetical protein [Streptomyces cavernae]